MRARTSELLLSLVLVVRGAGLTTANFALMAGAFEGLPRASVPDASSVTRIMQQVGGSFGTAVLAVILAGHSFQATFSRRRSGGAAGGYAAGPPDQSGGGTRSARRVTFPWRGDGTATGQLASAQTIRPG